MSAAQQLLVSSTSEAFEGAMGPEPFTSTATPWRCGSTAGGCVGVTVWRMGSVNSDTSSAPTWLDGMAGLTRWGCVATVCKLSVSLRACPPRSARVGGN